MGLLQGIILYIACICKIASYFLVASSILVLIQAITFWVTGISLYDKLEQIFIK